MFVNTISKAIKHCAVDIKKISAEAKKMLKMAEDYSFIIRSDFSKDKNHRKQHIK